MHAYRMGFLSNSKSRQHLIIPIHASGLRPRSAGSNFNESVAELNSLGYSFVQECVEKGISPYWDCSPDNTGSIRVAKTIGLSSSFDYKIFWYNLT